MSDQKTRAFKVFAIDEETGDVTSLAARGVYKKVYFPEVGKREEGSALFFFREDGAPFGYLHGGGYQVWEVALEGPVSVPAHGYGLEQAMDTPGFDRTGVYEQALDLAGLPVSEEDIHAMWRTGALVEHVLGLEDPQLALDVRYGLLFSLPRYTILCDAFTYVRQLTREDLVEDDDGR